jgi:hypothetical protein
LLLKLAQESPKTCCFVHISSNFSQSDRTGFVEERMYDTPVNWAAEYQKILGLTSRDIIG